MGRELPKIQQREMQILHLGSLICTRITGKWTGKQDEVEPVFGWWEVGLTGGDEAMRGTPSVLSWLRHFMFVFMAFHRKKRLVIVRNVPYAVAYG